MREASSVYYEFYQTRMSKWQKEVIKCYCSKEISMLTFVVRKSTMRLFLWGGGGGGGGIFLKNERENMKLNVLLFL